MKFWLVLMAVGLSQLIFVYGMINEDGNVLILDESNFNEALQQHSEMLVAFYAPWLVLMLRISGCL